MYANTLNAWRRSKYKKKHFISARLWAKLCAFVKLNARYYQSLAPIAPIVQRVDMVPFSIAAATASHSIRRAVWLVHMYYPVSMSESVQV